MGRINAIRDMAFCTNIECTIRNNCERSLYGIFQRDQDFWLQKFEPTEVGCVFFKKIDSNMIKQITTYTLICDLCGEDHNKDTEFTGWNHLKYEVQQAIDEGWLIDNLSSEHTYQLDSIQHFINSNSETSSSDKNIKIRHLCSKCKSKYTDLLTTELNKTDKNKVI